MESIVSFVMSIAAHPITVGGFKAAVAAALIDFAAFRKWQSHDEAMTYRWRLAMWRWAQGFVVGAVLTAFGVPVPSLTPPDAI